MSMNLSWTPIRFVCACVIAFSVTIPFCIPAEANVSYNVTLMDGSISPSIMTAGMDETVSIHVTNRGTKPHNLVIKDFFVFTQNLNPGENASVSFKPDKTGTFTFYSDTGGKPEAGMQGQITIR